MDGAILVGDTLYFSAEDGSSGKELWAHQPGEITSLSSGSGSGSGSGSSGGSSSSSSFAYANDKVSAGYHHTCAILDNGDLKCWGYDQYGQLGDGGSNTNTNAPSSTPIDLGTGRTAVAVSAGDHHTCAILDNGDLKCWGDDSTDSWAMVEATRTPTHLHPRRSTSARAERPLRCLLEIYHTCAILDNGDLKCWGWDTKDSWAMEEATRTPTHLHPPPSTSARAERPLRCLLEFTTPAPSLTTAT